jgi:glycosyltransferase involved in cell wall biosynthesis
MNIGILASNFINISENTAKGTEIFIYELISRLSNQKDKFEFTLFASSDSNVDVKTVSLKLPKATVNDIEMQSIKNPVDKEKINMLQEIALVSKAFKSNSIDLIHVNIGAGELALPFARLSKIPIVITIHSSLLNKLKIRYLHLFKNLNNVYFISISHDQRKTVDFLNYFKNIYHGINTDKFSFNSDGGDAIFWAGRGVPDKGLDDIMAVIKKTGYNAKIYPILKNKHITWMKNNFLKKRNLLSSKIDIKTNFDINRNQLPKHYQHAKLFLNPIKWEEPFGLVMIESMACGTPVVAYARGSVPEIIKDGETGFIVNSSDADIRGNWIIKKTGIEGLVEAVNKIYNMSPQEYQNMRLKCRKHVEKHFTIERMTNEYIKTYKEVIEDYKSKQK